MADPRITRDILRGALNKHGDNGDMDSFERVLTAMTGLEEEIGRYRPGHPVRQRRKATVLSGAGA